MSYVLFGLLVIAVNLLPAFGPPTWTLLAYARLRWHYDAVVLVLIGSLGAGLGRFLLAHAFRHWRRLLPERYQRNLVAFKERIVRDRRETIALATLFLVSPLPSAQLFCAAGLLDVRLLRTTLFFVAGRLVTNSFYVAGAVAADAQFGSVLKNFWGSPWTIALQSVLLVGLALLPLRHWRSPGNDLDAPS